LVLIPDNPIKISGNLTSDEGLLGGGADSPPFFDTFPHKAGRGGMNTLSSTSFCTGGLMNDAILILDDDPKVLETLAIVLEDLGLPLFRSTEPLAALQVVQKEKPRVVVTDLMMPQMSGLQVLQSVKAIDPSIQVVLVTGYGTIREAVDAIRDGAFDFICKPFNAALIEAVVRRALEASRGGENPDDSASRDGNETFVT
jgi:DNA-binding NtrC family response regulator